MFVNQSVSLSVSVYVILAASRDEGSADLDTDGVHGGPYFVIYFLHLNLDEATCCYEHNCVFRYKTLPPRVQR